ncbi:PLU-1-like protein-domain-containing protein [Tribonema minus]|uniref:PLU-1-like protein-domain-containing protein n=1 Tax=Tribonema minus TaxID=303371 RepID=A0A835YJI1_9STRA|nr:PLU-1-like protein-domain-containing protein [Tribonema minus]
MDTGEDGPAHVYPYVPPRIDAAFYQARIPDLIPGVVDDPLAKVVAAKASNSEGKMKTRKKNISFTTGSARPSPAPTPVPKPVPDLREGQQTPTDGRVWSPAAVDPTDVDAFLIFTRNLLQQTSYPSEHPEEPGFSWMEGDHLVPCEDDEQASTALHCLHSHGGDVRLAQFALHCLHSHGGDVRLAQFVVATQLGVDSEDALEEQKQGALKTPVMQLSKWQLMYRQRGAPLGRLHCSADPKHFPSAYAYPAELVRQCPPVLESDEESSNGQQQQQEVSGDGSPSDAAAAAAAASAAAAADDPADDATAAADKVASFAGKEASFASSSGGGGGGGSAADATQEATFAKRLGGGGGGIFGGGGGTCVDRTAAIMRAGELLAAHKEERSAAQKEASFARSASIGAGAGAGNDAGEVLTAAAAAAAVLVSSHGGSGGGGGGSARANGVLSRSASMAESVASTESPSAKGGGGAAGFASAGGYWEPQLDRGRRGADRTQLKAKWVRLVEQATAFIAAYKRRKVGGQTLPKPTHAMCLELLVEAATLALPDQSPGENFIEQIQNFIEQIQQRLALVLRQAVVMQPLKASVGTRECIAAPHQQRLILSSEHTYDRMPVMIPSNLLEASVGAREWLAQASDALRPHLTDSARTPTMNAPTILHACSADPGSAVVAQLLEASSAVVTQLLEASVGAREWLAQAFDSLRPHLALPLTRCDRMPMKLPAVVTQLLEASVGAREWVAQASDALRPHLTLPPRVRRAAAAPLPAAARARAAYRRARRRRPPPRLLDSDDDDDDKLEDEVEDEVGVDGDEEEELEGEEGEGEEEGGGGEGEGDGVRASLVELQELTRLLSRGRALRVRVAETGARCAIGERVALLVELQQLPRLQSRERSLRVRVAETDEMAKILRRAQEWASAAAAPAEMLYRAALAAGGNAEAAAELQRLAGKKGAVKVAAELQRQAGKKGAVKYYRAALAAGGSAEDAAQLQKGAVKAAAELQRQADKKGAVKVSLRQLEHLVAEASHIPVRMDCYDALATALSRDYYGALETALSRDYYDASERALSRDYYDALETALSRVARLRARIMALFPPSLAARGRRRPSMIAAAFGPPAPKPALSTVRGRPSMIAAAFGPPAPKPALSTPTLLLSAVRELAAEVAAICVVGIPEVELLQSQLSSTEKWLASADAAIGATVSFSTLQALLSSAEHLPIDVSDKVRTLQEKIVRANAWLERFRKAIPKQRSTSVRTLQEKIVRANAWLERFRKAIPKQRSTRRNEDTGDKMDLAHVKSLLGEKQALLGEKQRHSGETHLAHVKMLLGEEQGTGVMLDVKELGHVNGLVESAEGWMSRVREVLENGGDATVMSLTDLLREAEGIPVEMEEQQLLMGGLKARQWRIKVDEAIRGDPPVALPALRALHAEGLLLRSSFPQSAKDSHTYKAIMDDIELVALLRQGEQWVASAQRCHMDMQAGRLVPRSRLIEMVAEAQSLKLDLQADLAGIKEALADMNLWVHEAQSLKLDLQADLAGINEALADMNAWVQAQSLKLDLQADLAGINEALADMNAWVHEHAAVLTACGVLEDVPAAATQQAAALNSGSAAALSNGDAMDVDTSAAAAAQQPAAAAAAPPSPKLTLQEVQGCYHTAERLVSGKSLKEAKDLRAFIYRSDSKVSFRELEETINEGAAFPVDVSSEVDRLREHVACARDWQFRARQQLQSRLSNLAQATLLSSSHWKVRQGSILCGKKHAKHDDKTSGRDDTDATSDANGSRAVTPVSSESLLPKPEEGSTGDASAAAAAGGAGGAVALSADDSAAAAALEELEEAEDKHVEGLESLLSLKGLESLLSEARERLDLCVQMGEEALVERTVQIMRWARRVREAVVEDGTPPSLTLEDAKDLMKGITALCDLHSWPDGTTVAIPQGVMQGLSQIIQVYSAYALKIAEKIEQAERWAETASGALTRDSTDMTLLEQLLVQGRDLGVDADDLKKRLRMELQRCRSWLARVNSALRGPASDVINLTAMRKLIGEGDRLRLPEAVEDSKTLKAHAKNAGKWVSVYRRIRELMKEAGDIRVDLSELVATLKKGAIVECVNCGLGHHAICVAMDPKNEMLAAFRRWRPLVVRKAPAPIAETPSEKRKRLAQTTNIMSVRIYSSVVSKRKRLAQTTNIMSVRIYSSVVLAITGALNLDPDMALDQVDENLRALDSLYKTGHTRVLDQVDENLRALDSLKWDETTPSGHVQRNEAYTIMQGLRVVVWCAIMQWSLRARPSHYDIGPLSQQVKALKLTDPALAEVLEVIDRRARQYGAAVKDLFKAPTEQMVTKKNEPTAQVATKKGGATADRIDLKKLQQLVERMERELPIDTKADIQARAAMEDGGYRYCVCRGPNDGRFMIQCDNCEEWFHGGCANIGQDVCGTLEHYTCKACARRRGQAYEFEQKPTDEDSEENDEWDEHIEVVGEVTPRRLLWPPRRLQEYLNEYLNKLDPPEMPAPRTPPSEDESPESQGARSPSPQPQRPSPGGSAQGHGGAALGVPAPQHPQARYAPPPAASYQQQPPPYLSSAAPGLVPMPQQHRPQQLAGPKRSASELYGDIKRQRSADGLGGSGGGSHNGM